MSAEAREVLVQSRSAAVRGSHSLEQIRDWIVTELARAMRVETASIDAAAPLFSLGADSLVAISMTGALAEWLNRDLPITLMWDYGSIDEIAMALSGSSTAAPLPPGIISLHEGNAKSRLFCFPGAGGHSSTFAPLASHLGADHSCYGLIVPGMNGERPPLESVEQIAAAMLVDIRRVQPKGPYQLAGYSFGGLVAFEAAQQLAAAGDEVSLLAIYDTFTPTAVTLRPWWQRILLHGYLLAARPGRGDHVRLLLRRWRDRREILNTLRGQTGAPSEKTHSVAFEVEQANYKAALTYTARHYPGGIVLFRSADRGVEARFYKYERQTNGWGALATGGVRVTDLPGNHMSILNPEHSRLAADRLRPYLGVAAAGE
jgi:thioesterase domain-containing protein/acyl carrier protein